MKSWVLILALALCTLGVLACKDDGPTAPTQDEVGDWCRNYSEKCSWFETGLVKLYGKPILVSNARVVSVNNSTNEPHIFTTNQQGEAGPQPWTKGFDPSRNTLWITIDQGVIGGAAFDKYERHDVIPTCVADLRTKNTMSCAWVAELVQTGIGAQDHWTGVTGEFVEEVQPTIK